MKLASVIQLSIYITMAILGAYCVNYDLSLSFHRTIPFFWAFVITFITGNLSIMLAIVLKILAILGVIQG
jgi:hypothetical protein